MKKLKLIHNHEGLRPISAWVDNAYMLTTYVLPLFQQAISSISKVHLMALLLIKE